MGDGQLQFDRFFLFFGQGTTRQLAKAGNLLADTSNVEKHAGKPREVI
jgi:hypothetical protein